MKLITKRRRLNHDSRLILLPEVILSGASVDVIPVYEARPNFITAKTVEGEVVLLDEEPDADITGKIVVVPKADPGYEWILQKYQGLSQSTVVQLLIWQFDAQNLIFRQQSAAARKFMIRYHSLTIWKWTAEMV